MIHEMRRVISLDQQLAALHDDDDDFFETMSWHVFYEVEVESFVTKLSSYSNPKITETHNPHRSPNSHVVVITQETILRLRQGCTSNLVHPDHIQFHGQRVKISTEKKLQRLLLGGR